MSDDEKPEKKSLPTARETAARLRATCRAEKPEMPPEEWQATFRETLFGRGYTAKLAHPLRPVTWWVQWPDALEWFRRGGTVQAYVDMLILEGTRVRVRPAPPQLRANDNDDDDQEDDDNAD